MAELAALAAKLAGLLEAEAALLERAAVQLEADRKAYASGSAGLLAAAEAGWSALLETRLGRDRERALLLDRIGACIDLPAHTISVSKICSHLDPAQAAALRKSASSATKAARRAALQAAVGGDLLEEAARFQVDLIRRICDAARAKGTSYAKDDPGTAPPLYLLDTVG